MMSRMFWNRVTTDAGGGQGGGHDPFRGRPLGRVLTKMGKVNREQVVEALNEQKSRGGPLGEILVRLGYVTAADVEAALAAQRGERPPDGPG
jgi:hypothetical protein